MRHQLPILEAPKILNKPQPPARWVKPKLTLSLARVVSPNRPHLKVAPKLLLAYLAREGVYHLIKRLARLLLVKMESHSLHRPRSIRRLAFKKMPKVISLKTPREILFRLNNRLVQQLHNNSSKNNQLRNHLQRRSLIQLPARERGYLRNFKGPFKV
jgi:hypothetical protein